MVHPNINHIMIRKEEKAYHYTFLPVGRSTYKIDLPVVDYASTATSSSFCLTCCLFVVDFIQPPVRPFLKKKKSGTMVYISADGSVDGSRSRSRNPFKLLTDLFLGLINGILLFFRTISTPPERLPEVSSCSIRVRLHGTAELVVVKRS